MFAGALLFALVPTTIGVFGLCRETAYFVSVLPETTTCGLGTVDSFFTIFFVGPIAGVVGGAFGWGASRLSVSVHLKTNAPSVNDSPPER